MPTVGSLSRRCHGLIFTVALRFVHKREPERLRTNVRHAYQLHEDADQAPNGSGHDAHSNVRRTTTTIDHPRADGQQEATDELSDIAVPDPDSLTGWMAVGQLPAVSPGGVLPERRRRRRPGPQDLRGLPRASECLEYALEERIEHGVWGGCSERERRRILKRRRDHAGRRRTSDQLIGTARRAAASDGIVDRRGGGGRRRRRRPACAARRSAWLRPSSSFMPRPCRP